MKATLTLRKDDLLAKLEERKTEVNADYDERVKEIDDEIAGRTDETTIVQDTAAWFKEVSDGLTTGSITLTDTGKLRGASPKPKKGGVRPSRTSGDEVTWAWYNVEQLEVQRSILEGHRQAELKPLDTAIDLIGLSVDDTVEVDSADYQNLLSGSNRRYY